MELVNRFWAKVDKTDDCWEWTGAKLQAGYGRFKCNGKIVSAHRYSWEIHNGPIPEGLFVCHKCDNPSCVNPDHLFLGNNEDNLNDARKKGNLPSQKGEGNFNSILTEKKVLSIREEYQYRGKNNINVLSKKHNVNRATIHNVITRKSWSHI